MPSHSLNRWNYISHAKTDRVGRILDTVLFFFSSRRRHTRLQGDWSSDVCSSDLGETNRFPPFFAERRESVRLSVVPANTVENFIHIREVDADEVVGLFVVQDLCR